MQTARIRFNPDFANRPFYAENSDLNFVHSLFVINLNTISFALLIVNALENLLVEPITLSLNRAKSRFRLVVGDQEVEQNICEFLLTFSFLQSKDVEEYLLNPSSEYDQVRVPLSGRGRTITLPLCDFIHLRAAYAREMFELKLEDLLLRQGVMPPR